jgi:ABC-2 type transport system ATP-binding protein
MALDSPEARRRETVHEITEAVNNREFSRLPDYFAPDVEVVTREGPLHGVQHVERFFAAQAAEFAEFRMEVEGILEASDDTIVACFAVDRRGEAEGEGLRMWPAQVLRFEGDRIVFVEGYPRQRDALTALGIAAERAPTHERGAPGTAIELRGLEREFPGGIKAVDGIDLDVDDGEIYAFLGPNGAGKTTTVRMLVTLLQPTGGSAKVAGFDVVHQAQQVRQSIGVALQEAALDPLMTGQELMELQATLHGIGRTEAQRRARALLERVGLSLAANRRVGTYSGGMRRRLDLGMALVHEPRVLFLDEPTTGLDPQSRRAIWDEVRHLNEEGTTVFLTTQYLEEADQLANRVGIINRGRMAAEGTPSALKAKMGRSYLELTLGGADGHGSQVLSRFGEVMPAANGMVRVALAQGAPDIPPIVRALDEAGIAVESLRLVEPTLDDVFLVTTGEHLEGEAPEQPES